MIPNFKACHSKERTSTLFSPLRIGQMDPDAKTAPLIASTSYLCVLGMLRDAREAVTQKHLFLILPC